MSQHRQHTKSFVKGKGKKDGPVIVKNRKVICFDHDKWFDVVRQSHNGNMHHGKQKTWVDISERFTIYILFICC